MLYYVQILWMGKKDLKDIVLTYKKRKKIIAGKEYTLLKEGRLI